MSKKEPFLTGHIELLLLAILSRQPLHGYAIIEHLRTRSLGAFDLPEGTVYPALYRLEDQGLLSSASQAFAGRPRRTYRLTSAGARALEARQTDWTALVKAVNAVLKPTPLPRHG